MRRSIGILRAGRHISPLSFQLPGFVILPKTAFVKFTQTRKTDFSPIANNAWHFVSKIHEIST